MYADVDEWNEKALDQIFFCDPVVLESICYRTRAKRLINDRKTTGGLRKIWTGTNRLQKKIGNVELAHFHKQSTE